MAKELGAFTAESKVEDGGIIYLALICDAQLKFYKDQSIDTITTIQAVSQKFGQNISSELAMDTKIYLEPAKAVDFNCCETIHYQSLAQSPMRNI